MKVKITSDGTKYGTEVVDVDTGKIIAGVSDIELSIKSDEDTAKTTIKFNALPLEFIGDADVQQNYPKMGSGNTHYEVPACAAIQVKIMGVSVIFAGKRHNDCISAINYAGHRDEYVKEHVQGFMTTRGRFVTRFQALQLMKRAGRKTARNDQDEFHGGELFSEDLY